MALKINLNTPKVKLPDIEAPYLYWEDINNKIVGIIHYNHEKFHEVKLAIGISYNNSETSTSEELKLETYNNFLTIDLNTIPEGGTILEISLECVFSKITRQITRKVYLHNLEDILSILCSDKLNCSDTLICKK